MHFSLGSPPLAAVYLILVHMCVLAPHSVYLRLTANSSLFLLFEILRLRLTTRTDCVNPVPDTCQAPTV